MPWIESHPKLLNHPKTLDLMTAMGWDIDKTIAKLHRHWWWCMDFAPDGNLSKFGPVKLAAAVGIGPKKAGAYVAAMIQSGWWDEFPYLRVHDWWDFAGPFLRMKYKRHPEVWKKIKALYVKPEDSEPREEENEVVEEESRSECCTTDSTSDCPLPPNLTNLTNLTIPNQPDQPHHHQSARQDKSGGGGEGGKRGDEEAKETQESRNPKPRQATPGGAKASLTASEADFLTIIEHRVGSGKNLSPGDIEQLLALRARHGPQFYEACNELHGRVEHVPQFLEKVLTPKNQKSRLAEEFEALLKQQTEAVSQKIN